MENFKADEIKAAMKAVQKSTGQKGKNLFMPIRAAVSGQTHGPDLPQTIELLGKEKVLVRIQKIIG
jgi:nondiscriminating glutamyl-tRNA synthetase